MSRETPPERVSSWKGLGLWPHQIAAIKMIREYQKAAGAGSALVRIPTGAGKTGIMAVVAECFADTRDVLIVAPWAQLRGQLAREIEANFWLKLGKRPKQATKSVRTFIPSKAQTLLTSTSTTPTVFLCTNQTIERLHAKYPGAYRSLRERISLVLVDEGHREPAPEWARAIRGLKKPTILFTATPYRNDRRLFDVDPKFIFRLPHSDGVKKRFVRAVEFTEVNCAENARTFVQALLTFYQGEFLKRRPSAVTANRVIVRCETKEEITLVVDELKKAGQRVVAVHERFKTDDEKGHFYKVPDPTETDATFWVHQNKLIEGVDDPNFSLLAIYKPFRDARTLVQQVGRIIRNPSRMKDQVAHVFCHRQHRQRTMWESYLRYEERLSDGSRDVGPADVFQDLLQLQEQHQYLDGNFRERFNPTAPDFYLHLNYPHAANIYKPQDGFTMQTLVSAICQMVDEEDCTLGNMTTPDDRTRVFVYGRCRASQLLIDQTFMEISLGFAIVRMSGDYIFYFDSNGLTPEYLADSATRVEPAELERLLSGNSVRISQVSLLNSDLAHYSVRRRSLSAHSIAQLAPGLSDYAHFCSTAAGIVKTTDTAVRRYVGFSRARVSERSASIVAYQEYIEWLDVIAAQLTRNDNPVADLFDRYALHTGPPDDPKPEHILFDIDDVEKEYLPHDDTDSDAEWRLYLDDRCWDITNGEFVCNVNGQEVRARVSFDSIKRRFEITSPALEKMLPYHGTGNGRYRNLISYLNATQSFRIVTHKGFVYAHGQFYQSRMPLYGQKVSGRIDLQQILRVREELGHVTSEKGQKVQPKGTGWERGSIFEYIDRLDGNGLFASEKFNPDILVCDDQGNELADFIAVQSDPPRVAMVHAKMARMGSNLSASAFHDVCGQALKNLGILTPQWNHCPKKLDIWNKSWKKEDIGEVKRRIRRPAQSMTADAIWREIEKIVKHPAAVREVWVVMGHGMSQEAFIKDQQKKSPPASVIQLIYLLQATWSAVSSIGAVFKVHCKP